MSLDGKVAPPMTNASLCLPLDQEPESPAPGVCPMHGIAMDHHRLWSSGDVLICPRCNEHIRARRAWLDELPVVDDPFEALAMLFNDPRA